MAIVLDATIGGANSNSYLTVVRSNNLAETMPHMGEWLTDTDLNKVQLLVHATRLIDRYFMPHGNKASESQALMWPRKYVLDVQVGALLSDSVIPTFVEMATIEWAYALYENPDPYADVGRGLRQLWTPSYRMEFDGTPMQVVPRAVSMLLGPYSMRVGGTFHRVTRA